MSKIGRQPVTIPAQVEINLYEGFVEIIGPKGKIKIKMPRNVFLEKKENEVLLSIKNVTKQNFSNWGTARSLIANAVKGVFEGWQKQLELVGTGYRAELLSGDLVLNVGYSHTIQIKAPENTFFKVEKNIITVEGIDKEVVGQISADIRSKRPPEPYKGKGIKYIDEVIRRKAGKAAKTAA